MPNENEREIRELNQLRRVMIDDLKLTPGEAMKILCALVVDVVGQGLTREERRFARDQFVSGLDATLKVLDEGGFYDDPNNLVRRGPPR